MFLRLPTSTLFPYTTLFRSEHIGFDRPVHEGPHIGRGHRRIANVGAELLDLLLETLGVAARRRRESRDGFVIELDSVNACARGDPTGDVDRRETLDALD